MEDVAKGSDVIVTATQRLAKPLIKNEWFGPGCLGMGLEASRAWYGDAILKADKFVTDDWEQTKHFKSMELFPTDCLNCMRSLEDRGREKAWKGKGEENAYLLSILG